MNLLKNVLRGIFILALCSAIVTCTTQVTSNEKKEMHHHHSVAGSDKTPVTVMSWEHWRELYITDGKSEAEADSLVREDLAELTALDRSSGDDRIGIQAPPFKFVRWLNTEPLALEDLKGKVVLIRWFTETCPYCASSAPALRQLYEEYNDKDFVIIGVYHPKPGTSDPLDVQRVQRAIEIREFKFPIAIDWDWRNATLKDWWLTGPEREFTSVTFILDKSGVIQFIHPGMEYHEDNGSEQHTICTNDFGRIRDAIDRLIAE